jgi:formate dehydrogenase major subunit
MRQRGAATMVCADLNVPFGDSSCVECGTCLQVCPTGALIDKRSAFMDMGRNARVDRVKSICSQCSVGCGIEILLRDGNLIRVEGDWEAAPSGGVLCKKGRFDPLYETRERITRPMIRQGGGLEVVGWEQALEVAAERLGGLPSDRVGVLASAGASNEALYLVKTLFREHLGTVKTGLLADTLTRVDAPHGSLAQLAGSDLILVIGVDPVRHQPVVSYLVKHAVDRGTRLIVVDGPANDLAPIAVAHIDRAEFDKAVAWAARADAPAVLYGAGLSEAEVAGLAGLKRATFIGLESGANTRAAQRYGLNGRFDDTGLEALYMLLGEQPWNGTPMADEAFLVVQASYASALTERADVVLPAAIWCEQAGTWTNLEGRVQQARQAVALPGAAKPDWEILTLLAGALGSSVPASLDALSQLAAVGLK